MSIVETFMFKKGEQMKRKISQKTRQVMSDRMKESWERRRQQDKQNKSPDATSITLPLAALSQDEHDLIRQITEAQGVSVEKRMSAIRALI
jgi:hypothetical protein